MKKNQENHTCKIKGGTMTGKTTRILSLFTLLLLSFGSKHMHAQDMEKEINFSEHKILPLYQLKKAGNTTIFQGDQKENNYFEGWYFKMVTEDGSGIISVIPGISLSQDGKDQHAFIQIINGATAKTSYHPYPIDEFSFSKKQFEIKIGNNYFSKDKIMLDIQDGKTSVSGSVKISDNVDYTSDKMLNPGIMGWYRFVPFMECYHGVVSLTNRLKGELIINNKAYDFTGGKGYIEKDWGSSMPSSWIWMQSNHFHEPGTSFMLSIADIPWLGSSFTGFLGFLYQDGKTYHFSTYRNTKLQLEVCDSNILTIKMKNQKNTFIVQAESNNAGLLKAPDKGSMDRRIAESIDAVVKITMFDDDGDIVFSDSTSIAGLEMVGDYEKLPASLK